ncbi:efflux RND transporter periplasmic adaptor subunit [Gracilimonas mengyeensis]|uniref:RND family efflux transporter, MFP subunit n=1 Tax=Gracilimonas mengyeensis TaxID=1302730 RepID=A0A521AAR3_9BACT|nr:efflux RND transporter periplasmic adaptor subunit [Gracilimonas mengyeensis]SMO31811.1 RND family efflux transporter, MFP subunit [Gracilimonas mengyeensis]
MNPKKTALFSFGILVAGVLISVLIFSTEPTAQQSAATKETPMLVEVMEAQSGDFVPVITATGEVVPEQEIMLSPRVSGEVMARSSKFSPGGFVEKGDMLIQIDSTDYATALSQRQSELTEAQANLEMEQGRQQAALREYELYGNTLSEANKALVLRQPQLKTAQSQVESAKAAVRRAQLDLDRTTVRAPFDAHILSRNVNVGSQVSAGDQLGQLAGMDTYWVEATVPLSKLKWLTFREDANAEQASGVRIRNRTAWEEGTHREGNLYRMLGSLDDETRMARVLVTVDDPLSQDDGNANQPRMIIGSFVEVEIETTPLENVVRLSRDYLRSGETVWVMKNEQLEIREVDIRFQDQNYAYITDGLSEGEQVVTTSLASVSEGAPLRLEASAPNESSASTE